MATLSCEVCGKVLKASGFDWKDFVISPVNCEAPDCDATILDFGFALTAKGDLQAQCNVCGEPIPLAGNRKRQSGSQSYGWKGTGRFCSQKCAAESVVE